MLCFVFLRQSIHRYQLYLHCGSCNAFLWSSDSTNELPRHALSWDSRGGHNDEHYNSLFGVYMLMFLHVWFRIVEMKKIPLEEIYQLFGGDRHVEDTIKMKQSIRIEEVITMPVNKRTG